MADVKGKTVGNNMGKIQQGGAGAYIVEKHHEVPRGMGFVFCTAIFVCMLVPLVGILWGANSQHSSEELAAPPQIQTDDAQINPAFLADAGAWFEDHFAYRDQLVQANAHLRASLFGVSATSQVILGTSGWMYYEGTLDDYLGRNPLTQREAYNIAHNLALMQSYVQAQGSRFCFVMAPDKNSLYPQYMPYNYQQVTTNDVVLLESYLNEFGVNYIDVFKLFAAQDKELYFKQDSHWNDEGALLVANALVAALDREALPWSSDDLVTVSGFQGDLAAMLFPLGAIGENRAAVSGVSDGENRTGSEWVFVEGTDITDDVVRTAGPGEGSLVMYRDSFANNLLPYFAASYEFAFFSKLIPFNALLVAEQSPDCVVVERAQRHIGYLAEEALAMPSPAINEHDKGLDVDALSSDNKNLTSSDLHISVNGPLTAISGTLQGIISPQAEIYIRVSNGVDTERTYEAFTLGDGESGNNSFLVNLGTTTWSGSDVSCQVFVKDNNTVILVGSAQFEIE